MGSLARNAQLTHSLARNEGKVEDLSRNVSIVGALKRSDKLISASSGSRQFSTGRIFHINDKDGLIRSYHRTSSPRVDPISSRSIIGGLYWGETQHEDGGIFGGI